MSAYQATLRRITQFIRPDTGLSCPSDEIENYVTGYEFQDIKHNPNLKRIYREFALGMTMLHHNIGKTTAVLQQVAADNIRLLHINLRQQGILNSVLINLRTQPQNHRPISSRSLDLYKDSSVSSGVIAFSQGGKLGTTHVWFKPEGLSTSQKLEGKSACNLFLVLEGIVSVSQNALSWSQNQTGANECIVKRGGVILQDFATREQTINVISEQATVLYVHVDTSASKA